VDAYGRLPADSFDLGQGNGLDVTHARHGSLLLAEVDEDEIVTVEEFMERFEAGTYSARGRTIDGERLTRSEILDICFLLLLAGLDTVTATLGCNIAYLASNPSKRRSLVEDPSLVPTAVEELLRWETPVTGLPRIALQDVTIGDFEIREGELVTLLLGAANTDDEHFPEAQRVDFLRERNVHTAFGVGVHRCLGSHLARMELKVALEEWHRRIPDYRIEPGETPRVSPGIREFMYLPLVWDV